MGRVKVNLKQKFKTPNFFGCLKQICVKPRDGKYRGQENIVDKNIIFECKKSL
jgi:hypothetical protein